MHRQTGTERERERERGGHTGGGFVGHVDNAAAVFR